MADYQLTSTDMVVRTADGVAIPNDPRNRDRAEFEVWLSSGGVPYPFVAPPVVQTVLSQDLIAQFTATDVAMIRIAIDNEAAQAKSAVAASQVPSAPLNQLWAALQTQKDPMHPSNARFRAGWSALVGVLGQARMDAIAAALGVTV